MTEAARLARRHVIWLVPFGVVLAIVIVYASAAAASGLPADLADRIDEAASEGRNLEAEVGASVDERARHGNRRLNALVLALIAEHPDLVEAIVSAALTADPVAEANCVLLPRVA